MVKPPRDGNQSGRHLIIIYIAIIFRDSMYVYDNCHLMVDPSTQQTLATRTEHLKLQDRR